MPQRGHPRGVPLQVTIAINAAPPECRTNLRAWCRKRGPVLWYCVWPWIWLTDGAAVERIGTMARELAIGFDFGTTNSAIAVAEPDGGTARVLHLDPSQPRSTHIPTVLYLERDGTARIGYDGDRGVRRRRGGADDHPPAAADGAGDRHRPRSPHGLDRCGRQSAGALLPVAQEFPRRPQLPGHQCLRPLLHDGGPDRDDHARDARARRGGNRARRSPARRSGGPSTGRRTTRRGTRGR